MQWIVYILPLLIYVHADRTCTELQNLLAEPQRYNQHRHRVSYHHPILDANKGYVSGQTYTDSTLKTCTFNDNNRRMTASVISVKVSPLSVVNVQWTAPDSEERDCALFRFAVDNIDGKTFLLKDRLCKNHGIYHFLKDRGKPRFVWRGATERTIVVEAYKNYQVYAQIVKVAYIGPEMTGCKGATTQVYQSSTEKDHNPDSVVCLNDLYTNQPNPVYSSKLEHLMLAVLLPHGSQLNFTLSYYLLPAQQGCNHTAGHGQTGLINSPNYPHSYFSGMDCYYTVSGERHQRVKASFVDNLDAIDCHQQNDYVRSIDGVLDMCRLRLNQELQSSGNQLKLRFHSEYRDDESNNDRQRRFRIVWRLVDSCVATQTFLGVGGRIISDEYPGHYLNNQRCVYLIKVPDDHVAELRFVNFQLEPNLYVADCNLIEVGDYVLIQNKKYCGNWSGYQDRLVFRSKDNQIDFTFVTDGGNTSVGFMAEYRAVPKNNIDDCQTGQLYHDGFCYDIKYFAVDWHLANRICGYHNGTLAMVTSLKLQQFLDGLLKSVHDSMDKAYWIGASDEQYESDFTWLNGKRLAFQNWFSGWPQFDGYNRQPNDDGLSDQNCLEMRRRFSHPSKGVGYAEEFFWNDRDCRTKNPFVCQYPILGSGTKSNIKEPFNCNETIVLTASSWKVVVSSVNFPNGYFNFLDCYITIQIQPRHVLIADFSKFILEHHENCAYDYLEMWEEDLNDEQQWIVSAQPQKHCGDWSQKLKLIRRQTSNRRLLLHFVSDHSRTYTGFQLNVYMDDEELSRTLTKCNDKNLRHYANYCYLIVLHPPVDWYKAKEVCKSAGHHLADPRSLDEEMFLVHELLKEVRGNEFAWLGARSSQTNVWRWSNGDVLDNFTDWFQPVQGILTNKLLDGADLCLAVQQQFSVGSSVITTDRLYWQQRLCSTSGGYVCKTNEPSVTEGQTLEEVFDGTSNSGELFLPGRLPVYPNFFKYTARILAAANSRVLITFRWIDIEYQTDCRYDWLELRTFDRDTAVRLCGTTSGDSPDFASYANQAVLSFRSDHSIGGRGFSAFWQTVNISDCFVDTNQPSGLVNSVNFPRFYLNGLDCTTVIRAPDGHRIVLDFLYFDVGQGSADIGSCLGTDYVSVRLYGQYDDRRTALCGLLNADGVSRGLLYVSDGSLLRIAFHSDASVWSVGFQAKYEASNNYSQEINLFPNNSTYKLISPNFPDAYPELFCLKQLYRVPYGYRLVADFQEKLEYYHGENDQIWISDMPLDVDFDRRTFSNQSEQNLTLITQWNRFQLTFCSGMRPTNNSFPTKQRYSATVTILQDTLFWRNKSAFNHLTLLESCTPNPCTNKAACLSSDDGQYYYCQCIPPYLGAFCHLSQCDFNPCIHGYCEATTSGQKYVCHCRPGYTGKQCEEQIHACLSNPCQNGLCIEGLGTFTCECYEDYKGEFCEKRNLFRAETLRESYLRDPFWLGLFLVLGVMGLVGIVHCFRKRVKYSRQYPSESTMNEETPPKTPEDTTDLASSSPEGEERTVNAEQPDEVLFTLQDLGINASSCVNLGHLKRVNFRLQLNELSDQQLNTLETYLEHMGSKLNLRSPCRIGRGAPDSGQSGEGRPVAIAESSDLGSLTESVTDIILKSAVAVSRDERKPSQPFPIHPSRSILRRCTTSGMTLKPRQSFTGAASKAMRFVRRPQSAELSTANIRETLHLLPFRTKSAFVLQHSARYDGPSTED